MEKLNSSARLKVKRDLFFLPDSRGGVYFRNNMSSFRMEGDTIDKWIEKLVPMFDGEHSMEVLTDGLPDPYRDRVYEIAEILYGNGFVRDVSQDHPHALRDEILGKYASQFELLDDFGGSGAYRFQTYRQAKVLAVGSGPFFVSLAAALLESGLPEFHILVTDSEFTDRQRLAELEAHARHMDSDVAIKEVTLNKGARFSWQAAVRPFDAVLYVSKAGDIGELQVLHAACRAEKKMFLPAVIAHQTGMAGPLVRPDSEACWESAWRRVHRSALCKSKDSQQYRYSSTAGAMLANVIVFDWFKTATGMIESGRQSSFFLLDLETLEGSWHSFMPHPLVTGLSAAEWVTDIGQRIEKSTDRNGSNGLLSFFGGLTSPESGLLHLWEEGDLRQLPLAQCRVQAVDPLSEGPAELLPAMTCSALTHEKARREAGLAGIEAYVLRLAGPLMSKLPSERASIAHGFVGVGAGETVAEGISRGLQKCLAEELAKQAADRIPSVCRVRPGYVEDEPCRIYLQALTAMQDEPVIGWGEEVSGFPVAWVESGARWYGAAGLNSTMALRNALLQALQRVQNRADLIMPQALDVPAVRLGAVASKNVVISACEQEVESAVVHSALQTLKRNSKRLLVVDLMPEPFFKKDLAGVFGVMLREGESM